MLHIRNLGRGLVLVALIGLVAGLAGCSSNVRTGAVDDSQYDMVVSAYMDGQFKLDGAVLADPDLDGHFEYLQTTNNMPRTVLLKDSDDSKVRSGHLRDFARLQAKYGFKGFVEHKGEVKPLQPKGGK